MPGLGLQVGLQAAQARPLARRARLEAVLARLRARAPAWAPRGRGTYRACRPAPAPASFRKRPANGRRARLPEQLGRALQRAHEAGDGGLGSALRAAGAAVGQARLRGQRVGQPQLRHALVRARRHLHLLQQLRLLAPARGAVGSGSG